MANQPQSCSVVAPGDAVMVRWSGELLPAIVRKLCRNGKVQVAWAEGTVSLMDPEEVLVKPTPSTELNGSLCRGDAVVVRWHGELHCAIVRKVRGWKVQVRWNDGTSSCVGRHEVHYTYAPNLVKRKSETQQVQQTSSRLGRPLKKHRSMAHLACPPRFAPPLCWDVLGPMDWRGVVFLPQFLSSLEAKFVTAIAEAAVKDTGLVPVLDRTDDLKFDHTAYRIDQAFWEHSSLFEKVIGTMRWADDQIWNTLSWSESRVYPEPEFIRYKVGKTTSGSSRKYAIEPHVDNHSAVTFVCLLSRPEDFEGGSLVFKAVTPGEDPRVVKLSLGDAVAFRGEKLLHWVTPLTSGARDVLQVELSRV
eukprot:TRINITY_DN30147_c0_g1_i1.p1 TRINITY_DN30147_c0_g1~~TRINITY_DN30147_c0_g1_i1.p1  ORF type:complete len:361 (+),score=41.35 TRINITY_DN30147_c0_g1_i1:138-1220(+)